MKIKFTGVPGEKHESISMYGLTFPLNKSVEVKDHVAIRKLSNHPHFEAEGADVTDVEFKETTAPAKPMSRAQLERQANRKGLKVDGRWSDETLAEEIERAGDRSIQEV